VKGETGRKKIIREVDIPLQCQPHREKINKKAGHMNRTADLMDLTDGKNTQPTQAENMSPHRHQTTLQDRAQGSQNLLRE
jgi:hypothetical protein